MDQSLFKPFCKDKFRVGDSFALIGKSNMGKSTVVETLLTNFSTNFAASIQNCKRIVIVYRALQGSYRNILAAFPDKCEKILSPSVNPEWLSTTFWTDKYTNSSDFSILLVDDKMSELSEKDSMELKLLSSVLFIGGHHSSLILLTTLQALGTSNVSTQLRMLLKNFSVYLLFAGLPLPTVRYLSTFLAPSKNSNLVALMSMIPRTIGSYLVVDDRIHSKTRFQCQSVLSSDSHVYMVFN